MTMPGPQWNANATWIKLVTREIQTSDIFVCLCKEKSLMYTIFVGRNIGWYWTRGPFEEILTFQLFYLLYFCRHLKHNIRFIVHLFILYYILYYMQYSFSFILCIITPTLACACILNPQSSSRTAHSAEQSSRNKYRDQKQAVGFASQLSGLSFAAIDGKNEMTPGYMLYLPSQQISSSSHDINNGLSGFRVPLKSLS